MCNRGGRQCTHANACEGVACEHTFQALQVLLLGFQQLLLPENTMASSIKLIL